MSTSRVAHGYKPYSSSRRSHTSLTVGNDGTACQSVSTGTRPAIATVAECSNSCVAGPVNVAPTITRRDSSTRICDVPLMPSPCVDAPETSPVGKRTTRTSMPRSRACASLGPTAHTCGSVNVTRVTKSRLARSRASLPAITSPAIRAWYLPMCVSSASPLQSPTAYNQPPATPVARSVSSGLQAHVVDTERRRGWLTARGHQDLVADHFAAVAQPREDCAQIIAAY